jgi:ParB-like chromosome segregation protein Spo0J
VSDEQTVPPEIQWRGAPDLVPFLMALSECTRDPRNARKHPDTNLLAIKRSLETFGQLKPIVVKGGRILAGNGTHEAMEQLGWNAVAVVRAPDSMSDAEAIAFALADNKTTDLSEWDFQEVAGLLREMPETLRDATGFSEFEIEPMLQADWSPPARVAAEPEPAEQWETVERVINQVRAQESDPDIPAGRCVELACADYLAGVSE